MHGLRIMIVVGAVATLLDNAAAQTGVPVPSPMDVIQMQGQRADGPCGSSLSKSDHVINEIQEVYGRAGRCGEYRSRMYFDYRIDAIKGEEERPGEVTVPGYFAYYDLNWAPPFYRNSAAPSSIGIDRASHVSDAAAATASAPGQVGACGLPYANENTRKVQETSAQNGMCDWYRDNVGAGGN